MEGKPQNSPFFILCFFCSVHNMLHGGTGGETGDVFRLLREWAAVWAGDVQTASRLMGKWGIK